MPNRAQLSVVAVSLLTLSGTLFGVSASLNAQISPSAQEAITLSQLKTLLSETGAIQLEKAETRRMLSERSAQLPDWFPPRLVALIGGRLIAANPAKTDLPIYQKYLTKQQADQLIVFFHGAAGEAVASHTSLLTPLADFAALVDARLDQIDPQQRAAIRETLLAFQTAEPLIAASQKAAFDTAYEKAMQEVISQNRSEYEFASMRPIQFSSGPTTDGFRPR